MSEYVFNVASNDEQNGGMHAASVLVATLVETLAQLDDQLAGPPRPFKLPQDPWELLITVNAAGEAVSLGEIINDFYGDSRTRELASYFDALQCYSPAAEYLDDQAIEAILRLEPTGPAAGHEAVYEAICDSGIDAMQCAVMDGTLISLAHARWDFDLASVMCGNCQIYFDHASRPPHVNAIFDRRLNAARADITLRNFEAARHNAFSSLHWGQDVAEQLKQFPSEYLGLAFKRLASLDDIARRWQDTGSAVPDPRGLELKGESDLTMQNYANLRRFRSSTGEMRTYETHIWIDQGNRIHLFLNNEERTIEVGYVGKHLRTWRF